MLTLCARLGALAAAAVLLAAPGLARAAEPEAADPEPPVVDLALERVGRDHGIPWDRLGPGDYALVREVVDGAVVAREVTDIAFRSRKPVFDFLLEHPDFAADVARALRAGKYRVRRVDRDVFEAEDGHGARALFRPVHAEGDRRLFYLEGRYEAPLLPTLGGRLVVALEARHRDAADGTSYCDMRLAGYLRVDSPAGELLTQVVRALSEAAVERKVRRFFRHVATVSRRAYDDPEGLAHQLEGHPGLPGELVARFREVLLAHLPPAWAETQRWVLLDPAPLQAPLPPAPEDAAQAE